MVPMILLIRLACMLMALMVVTTFVTAMPPCAAILVVSVEIWLAWTAVCELSWIAQGQGDQPLLQDGRCL